MRSTDTMYVSKSLAWRTINVIVPDIWKLKHKIDHRPGSWWVYECYMYACMTMFICTSLCKHLRVWNGHGFSLENVSLYLSRLCVKVHRDMYLCV